MKKVLALLFVVCMMFTVTACGNAQSEDPDTKFVCIEAAVEAENIASYVIKCEYLYI
jgi:basic membrane lipoprotein Med (substrate-binding protein (PBP1-ABC) superfamily)